MAYDLALAAEKEPNLAAVEPLQEFFDSNGKPHKPFNEWLKTQTQELEKQNEAEWQELSLIWEYINRFIEGKQMLRRKHRGLGWDVIPLPESTSGAVREQNKLGFYSRVLMSKWVASRTKVQAIAGDDSDQSQEAAKSGQVWYEAIDPMVYTEQFRQEEALAGQIHGAYARYFYYDEEADGGYGYQPNTEQRSFKAGEDTGECFDCGYGGLAAEFGSGSPEAAADPLAVADSQGSVGPVAEMGQVSADSGAIGVGETYGGDSVAPTCPACGGLNTVITPAAEEQIEVLTGVSQYKLGNLKGISVPYSQIRHEIACSAEQSPWFRWKRRLRMEEIKAKFNDLKVPTADAKMRDPGLEYEDAMRRSVASNAATAARSTYNNKQHYADFSQWWFAPCMYADYTFPTDVITVAGETIPVGTRATDIFPDGLYVAMVEGIDAPLQVSNESHKWHWVTAPYHLRLFTGLGIGINDAVEMQRQWNVILSLVFTQIRTAALPGWLYDKDSLEPDDVRRLSLPQNSVPVSLRNRPEGTRIEQLVMQMQPGQIPSHIPWYIQQLDANMQTAAGALVNEGVPGTDSTTATGTQAMVSASNQHNAPEFALKGDADVRSAYVLFDLSKKHFIEPRYLPLTGKRGKQGGVWLSAADFANGQVKFEAVRDSWLPNTKADKQESIKGLLLIFGGIPGLIQAMDVMPDFVDEVAEAFSVDIAGDIFEPTALLCRQRVDQIQELAQMYAPVVEQAMMLGAISIDPMSGMPIDPLSAIAQEIVDGLQPPVEVEEPAHMIAVKWLREIFLDDEMKEADPLTRACVKALIRTHLMAAAQEQAIMAQFAMIGQPLQPMGEEGQGQPKGPQQSEKPKKTEADNRKTQANANMSPNQIPTNPRPQPRPQPVTAMR